MLRGKPQEALVEIQKEPEEIWRLYGLAITQHAVKDHKKGDEALAGLIRKHQGGAAYQIAEAYAFRGETDRAFEWLERAYAQRDGGLLNLKVSPFLAGLRPDPRYAALLKRMRLPK
ncbi:MAG TPA: hypothetical protein VGN09_05515 [Vicinamibacteria bacterium]